jgi:hypothetical protein
MFPEAPLELLWNILLKEEVDYDRQQAQTSWSIKEAQEWSAANDIIIK